MGTRDITARPHRSLVSRLERSYDRAEIDGELDQGDRCTGRWAEIDLQVDGKLEQVDGDGGLDQGDRCTGRRAEIDVQVDREIDVQVDGRR